MKNILLYHVLHFSFVASFTANGRAHVDCSNLMFGLAAEGTAWASFGAPLDDADRRPRRPDHILQDYSWNDWGIQRYENIKCPSSVDEVVEDVTNAIEAVFEGREKFDPNKVRNMMYADGTHGRKPVRYAHDVGRLGVDIEGAERLIPSSSPSYALRSLALRLAVQLSLNGGEGSERPVVVYCNTIRQALSASEELRLLRAEGVATGSVTISYLGSGDLPASLRSKEKAIQALKDGAVDPSKGIIIIVQPTDYNDEYKPPGPAIGSVQNLQKIIARASIAQTPVIVLSPRYPGYKHWDKAASPWILRDFRPPIYTWVGSKNGVGLLQSVNLECHAWHVFYKGHYLASTSSAAGRPTKEIADRIIAEFRND